MQNTLSIKADKKTIVSKPFDFKAMCLVNDAHNDDTMRGPINYGKNAVDYLFEGTDATQAVIDALPVGEHVALCMAVWKMYLDAFEVKNG